MKKLFINIVRKFGCHCKSEVSEPIQGTNTAVVEIALDKNGMPTVFSETIKVEIGKRVVWLGPEEFVIEFPEESPFKENKLFTQNGVINEIIPEEAFEYFSKQERFKKFKYNVIVRDQVLDPYLVIIDPR